MDKFRLIVLNTGYVETGSLGMVALIYQHFNAKPPFEGTPQEFVTNLANALFSKWWSEISYMFIKDYKTRELEWNRIAPPQFKRFIINLPSDTADSFGCEDIPGWWPWNRWDELQKIPLEQTIHIFEKAEELLPLYVAIEPETPDLERMKQLYGAWLQQNRPDNFNLEEYREKLFKRVCTVGGERHI